MNNKSLVKLSNTIGIISIILLIYWVFVFISIQVFGLKVFRENLTETFYLSIVGILALMVGALIINIMFNLTRIAEKHNLDNMSLSKPTSKRLGLFFVFSFPIIFILLFVGDYLSSNKKEEMLIQSARSIIENNKQQTDKLLNYSFNKKWITETSEILELYSKTDKHFPYITVITIDSINHSQVFLGFGYNNIETEIEKDTVQPTKKFYIRPTTNEERGYFDNVFFKNINEVRFGASDGRYELFYPYFKNGKKIILYFSEYQRYGKIGN